MAKAETINDYPNMICVDNQITSMKNKGLIKSGMETVFTAFYENVNGQSLNIVAVIRNRCD